MGFKKTSIIVAIILLILSLVGIGIALTKASQNKDWPPQINKCPDYWDLSGNKCENTLKIGSDTCAPIGLDPLEDKSKTNRCAKFNEINTLNGSTQCGGKITWDGVTNNNKDC